ncbi:MAG: iron chelate uptake ABC transporter family permease subunit [Silicimonas sp.]|nr:iron chelate uptake ABC transporter family permease subunit [Silicimonas sp.]
MHAKRLAFLSLALGVAITGYMVLGARGSWSFILPFRGAKLAALLLVAMSISTATLLFQTIARNRILTPSIMGFDALYVMIVTLAVFFLGSRNFLAIPELVTYLTALAVMVLAALLLFGTLLLQTREDIMRMMLTGVILGALFRSLTSFATRMIDPNEYAVIQVASYARFNQIDTDLLGVSALLCLGALLAAWRIRHRLDVLALGREAAINLGLNPRRAAIEVLILVAVLVAVSTAFVGPIAFLGLLVVSLAHLVTPSGSHAILLPSAALISALTLVGGQTLLDRVLGLSTPLAVVIDFLGGILFLALLLTRMRR